MKPIGLGRRRLGVLALPALGLPALAACGSSPEPGLYTLAVRQGPSLPKGPRVVQLRDIGLPGYLDRKEIVRSSEDYKLDVRANAWWGEPLGSMLGREHPLLAAAAERPFTKLPALANCSVTQLEWPGPRLVSFNETGHLG